MRYMIFAIASNEWVGFIVSVALFLYLMLRKKTPPQQKNVPPLAPPKPVKAKVIVPSPKAPEVGKQAPIVSSYFEKGVKYDLIGKAASSRAHRLLLNLKDIRDMVILHEIIGPPKCKRR